jgi:hypothetical protein
VAQILALRADGVTLRGIADRLNDEGTVTSAGARWEAVKVFRVIKSPRGLAMASQAGGV